MPYDKHTLESFVFCPNIDEPFEWTRQFVDNEGPEPENVYFKSQNSYTYTQAKDHCNRQGDSNSTGLGIHSSQLWMLFDNGTLKNKQNIWKSKENVKWKIVPTNRKQPDSVWVSGENREKVPEKTDSDVNTVRPRY